MAPRQITQKEALRIQRMHREGATYREITAETGRIHGTIGNILRKLREGHDFDVRASKTPAERWRPTDDYERIDPIKSDEMKHLQLLHAANGYGFAWYPIQTLSKLYKLEWAPQKREFWRAA